MNEVCVGRSTHGFPYDCASRVGFVLNLLKLSVQWSYLACCVGGKGCQTFLTLEMTIISDNSFHKLNADEIAYEDLYVVKSA